MEQEGESQLIKKGGGEGCKETLQSALNNVCTGTSSAFR